MTGADVQESNVVTRAEWEEARSKLLRDEKAPTRARDAVAAQRRRLPQVDNLGHPAHLAARDTALVLVSRAPLQRLLKFRRRMGWQVPWYSSAGSSFNADFGATTGDGQETSGLSVFLREEGRVLHTYSSFSRGGDALVNTNNYLDLTPLGRQEEHLPYPQAWWRHHDGYEPSVYAPRIEGGSA
jgi:predicted dithiol-disulfide oxidoreductase (DUF899 family)